ncbi:MAG: hypothetical protein G01um101448_109 [Parcubacteria group bacterium Gr01-1014_48]|nr:MAG: hypothetical protein Greene041614_30 [Parcubacteria group bacterium Greene0416_14]TSC74468.1 MAG: hypothetical protein G01um101448_109 [Parcubacteria group bacterium Gr01-1014_48]TSD01778.1 MAG: hypothetical protein Greene101415_36 [Parcubacteria group bacterium Greene1014_15]TSD08492.1 MAG: hypothetical protein Greene07144_31 [Parcubacteria group bacterium Greene0714_4]
MQRAAVSTVSRDDAKTVCDVHARKSISSTRKDDFLLAEIIGFSSGFFAIVSLACIEARLTLAALFFAWILFPVLTGIGIMMGFILARTRPIFFQIVKFGMVGGFNTMLELSIINVLIVIFDAATGILFVLFKTASFIVAAGSAYFWNRNWTFVSRTRASFQEFGVFIVSGFWGFLINISTATFLVSVVPAPDGMPTVLWVNYSVLIAVLVGMVWNFLFQRFILFRD